MVQSAADGQQENGGRLDYDEAVLEVAALIPPGRVLSYGDVAELLGSGGPRQVGKAMSRSGSAVCWWRVLRADGSLPADLQALAEVQWVAEGTPQRGSGVHMKSARWEPGEPDHLRIDEVAALLPVPKRRTPLI